MRKPKRKALERMVSSLEGSTSPPRSQSAKQASATLTPASHKALTKAVDGIPGMSEIRTAAEEIQAQRAKAMRQYLDQSKRVAAERAAALHGIRGLVDDTAPEPDGIAPEIEPSLPVYFIRTSPGGSLHDQQIADGDTWAKWDCTVTTDAIRTTTTETLSFFFLWQNPRKRSVRANITSGLSMWGHGQASADGHGFPASLFFPDSRVDVAVRTRLTIWPLWLPNTAQPFQTMDVASCGASGGSFSHSQGVGIATNAALQTIEYFVPREAYLLIETSVVADISCLGGTGEVDFASADALRVDFPYCYVND
jgi:hypothetical protein